MATYTPTVSIEEVAGSATQTSVQVRTTFQYFSPKGSYYAKWTYSPTGQFNNAKTITERFLPPTSVSEARSIVKTLPDLIPEKGYIIQVDVYEGSINANNIVAEASTSFATEPLGGVFNYTSRSSSVITMALTGLEPLDFDGEVEISYKRSGDTSWTIVKTESISTGEVKDVTNLFMGLNTMTSYNFKAELYKGTGRSRVLYKTFEKTVSTLIYSGIINDITPSIKEVIAVPLVRKGKVIAELSEELPSGCSVHLLQSDDDALYTDIGAMPNDLIGSFESETEYTYLKLVIVDANNNRYNMTEPTRVRFTPFTRSIPSAGQTFNIMAVEVGRFANALISLYKYLYIMYGGGVWEYEDLYNALVAKMGTLKSGVPVEGGEGSGWWLIHSLANAINGDDPIEPKEAGDIIYATDYVQLGLSVKTALQSIAD